MAHLCRMSWVKSLLSYAWPITAWEGPGKYGPLRLVWESGHLVVNSGHANQSYGNLHAIWQQCLEDRKVARRDLTSILILGFGAGSSASILRKEMGVKAPIIGVDGDPEMVRLARTWFKVERLPDLDIRITDAMEFMEQHNDAHDLILVDLCHELDLAPGVDEAPFIIGLRKCTAPGGLVCFNTVVHDDASSARSQRVSDLLRLWFDRVDEHLYQGINRVLTATWTNKQS